MTGIGGTLTQNRFADFLLTAILMEMLWSDLNTKQYRRSFANNITIDRHWWDLNTKCFVDFLLKLFLWTCNGGTLTPNRFADFC